MIAAHCPASATAIVATSRAIRKVIVRRRRS
jgi:hypothetical protein